MDIHIGQAAESASFFDSNFVSGVGGALLGAIVGGLISYLLQRQASKEAARMREAEEKARREETAYSIFFKTAEIAHVLGMYCKHIETEYQKVPVDGGTEPFCFVRPPINIYDPVSFTPQEMTLLLSLDDDALFNEISLIPKHHRASMNLLTQYGRLREELMRDLPAEMNGIVGTTVLTEEEVRKFRPKMAVLNDLIGQAKLYARPDYDKASDVLSRLRDRLADKLGFKFTLKISDMKPSVVDDKSKTETTD